MSAITTPYEKLSAFLGDVRYADVNGGAPRAVSERLQPFHSRGEFGFSVPEHITESLIAAIFTRSYLLSRVTRHRMTRGNALSGFLPDESQGTNDGPIGDFNMPQLGEEEEFPFSYPKMRAISMLLLKNGAVIPATEEIVEDGVAYEAMLNEVVARTLIATLERKIWQGSGVGTALGVCHAPALIVQPIEGSQTIANTAQYIGTNAAKMVAQMLDLESAAFFINPDLLTDLLEATSGGDVRPVLTPPDPQAPLGRIATRPVFPNTAAPVVGTVGDFVCASMSDYLLLTKGDVKSAVSIHVRFLQGESLFRFSLRWNGQPMLGAPYTPPHSTRVKSHYVALAARS